MNEILEKLFKFMIDNKVNVCIDNIPSVGSSELVIRLRRGKSSVERRFYYVPTGELTYKNFMTYNPTFEHDIDHMIKELDKYTKK